MPLPHVQLAPVRLLGVALASVTLAVFDSLAALRREGWRDRLYVCACFQQTLAWTRKLGSQQVHDIQGTYERNAQGTEEY